MDKRLPRGAVPPNDIPRGDEPTDNIQNYNETADAVTPKECQDQCTAIENCNLSEFLDTIKRCFLYMVDGTINYEFETSAVSCRKLCNEL